MPGFLAPLAGAAMRLGALGGRAGGGKLLERLWTLDSAWNLASRLIGDTLPAFQHACTVVVVGGPMADLRRVWYLCASVAFGRMLRSPAKNFASSSTMQATWDVTGKATQIELVYQASKLPALVASTGRQISGGIDSPASVAGTFSGGGGGFKAAFAGRFVRGVAANTDPLALIQEGPDQITLGSGWPDFLLRVGQDNDPRPGSSADPVEGSTFRSQVAAITARIRVIETAPLDRFPRDLLREFPQGGGAKYVTTTLPHRLIRLQDGGPRDTLEAGSRTGLERAPTLPDDGRLITSGEKTNRSLQPPAPILDGATRTSLVELVAATLATPCFLPEAPPITGTPLFNRGVFVHDSGAQNDYATVATLANQQRAAGDWRREADANPAFPGDQFPDGGDGVNTTVRDVRGVP